MKRNEQIDHSLLSSVLFLAERGFSAKAIEEATGLTESQIRYRTSRFEVKLSDYRAGKTQFAQKMMAQTECVKYGLKAQPGEKYKVAEYQTKAASVA